MRSNALGICFLAITWLVGCQTTAPEGEVKVPAVLDPLFIPCHPGDGATTLQIYDAGQLLGSGEAEWLAKGPGSWDVEVSSNVGQTLLKVHRRDGGVRTEGKLSTKLPKLSVDAAGFLEVDGHFIGLKADEVPCLLNFGLPRAWMEKASRLEVLGRKTTVEFAEARRAMAVTLTAQKVCAELTWRRILWFHDSLTWCQAPTGKREATLTGIGDYLVKWVKLDDQ